MNKKLRREICKHILSSFGAFATDPRREILIPLLLDKKLFFEMGETGEYHQTRLWSGSAKAEDSVVQFLLAELSNDSDEFAIVIQLDNYPPYIIRIDEYYDLDTGSFLVYASDQWIQASNLVQAKVLVAVETLFESLITWQKPNDTASLYAIMVSFLKHESEQEDDQG